MKNSLSALCMLMFLAASVASPSANADLILAYDSLLPASGGSATALSRIDSVTDNVLVASSAANNTFGSKAIMAAVHPSQSNVNGTFGDQNDLQFRFGSNTGGSGTLGGALNAGHAASGPRIDFSYTAAADQTLDEFSFHLFVNSNNASSYAARDVGLFVSVAGEGFAQFGALDLNSGRGNLGTVVFSDSLSVGAGDLVEFRLAFTDRTRTNNDLQAATRIGDVQISATAIPEPGASLVMLGFAVAAGWRRRR